MGKPLRVLIVEDSEDDALLLLRELRRGDYDVTSERVETAEAMTAALEGQTWDVVLSDFKMPHFSGPAALSLLQQSGIDLPFIIVSGTVGESTAVLCMKAGAHDYIMKGKLKRLVPAIEREMREAEVRRERKRAEERQNLATQVLDLLNRSLEKTDMIRNTICLIRQSMGFEAVGIRLREGEDFPYYETSGFPADFVEAERYL